MAWTYSIGNLSQRAPRSPVAVSPATADALYPLWQLGSGYPDQQGALTWLSAGAYSIDFDLNLLRSTSDRSDAPTGWVDLLNLLSYTPGLPTNAPSWGTYAGRATSLRLYRPVVQEVDVMPGEDVKLEAGIYRPSAAAGATGVRVRVVDTWSGKGWNGSAWASGGVLDSQSSSDAWKDFAEEITADATRTERSTYQVIFEPIATTYDATSYVYVSMNGGAGGPVLYAEVDLAAIVGHNLPTNATVAFEPQPSGTSITLTPAQPSMYGTATAQFIQTWRLTITMPAGNQPRPLLGEIWLGTVRTLPMNPALPVGVTEASPGQIILETARLRKEVLADEARAVTQLTLSFRTGVEASFGQVRAEVIRGTRSGADPLLLIPEAILDGSGRLYHGRIDGQTFAWNVETMTGTGLAFRTFGVPFSESPFASP